MRFHRPARRIALGLGAAGLVLGASGATAAATDLIQPAGALSVQVPAVAVREQNVNSAGRIRVALPKGGVGVNGSVAVSNLPVNSAGRVQTQNGNGTAELAQTSWGATFSSAPTVLVDVTGSGIFKGANLSDFANNNCLAIQGSIDGMGFYYQINCQRPSESPCWRPWGMSRARPWQCPARGHDNVPRAGHQDPWLWSEIS